MTCRNCRRADDSALFPLERACLEVLDETAGITTAHVSRDAKTSYCIGLARARSGAIRYALARLMGRELVAHLDHMRPIAWVRTPAGTKALGEDDHA